MAGRVRDLEIVLLPLEMLTVTKRSGYLEGLGRGCSPDCAPEDFRRHPPYSRNTRPGSGGDESNAETRSCDRHAYGWAWPHPRTSIPQPRLEIINVVLNKTNPIRDRRSAFKICEMKRGSRPIVNKHGLAAVAQDGVERRSRLMVRNQVRTYGITSGLKCGAQARLKAIVVDQAINGLSGFRGPDPAAGLRGRDKAAPVSVRAVCVNEECAQIHSLGARRSLSGCPKD